MNLDDVSKYVINLTHRTDRLGSFVREIHKTFKNKDFTIIDGVIKETPKLGIWQAFKNCIQDAKNKNHSYILVMEDDVVFRDGAYEYANECLKNLPKDWDILLGGLYSAKELIEYNSYWNKVIDFSGGHCMIISSRIFDKLLNMEEKIHVDRTLARNNIFNCYVVKKLFTIQAIGFSDKNNKYVDHSELLKDFELL
jgi:hypothetical protein